MHTTAAAAADRSNAYSLHVQLVNYGVQYIPGWGWRLALGLAALPACILCVGAIVLPESPSYLIEQ